MADTAELRLGLDLGRVSRIRDALTGGKLARTEDRLAAERVKAAWPWLPGMLEASRQAHSQAAAWAVTAGGMAGVVFGACGLPYRDPPHTAAARQNPRARFVYASVDEEATLINQAVLADADPHRVSAVRTSVFQATRILRLPELARFTRAGDGRPSRRVLLPFMVQIQNALHWLPACDCARLICQYAELLPGGSALAITMVVPGSAGFIGTVFPAEAGTAQPHSEEAVAGWIRRAGLLLVPPGITDVRDREMGWVGRNRRPGPGPKMIELVAVKPRGLVRIPVARHASWLPGYGYAQVPATAEVIEFSADAGGAAFFGSRKHVTETDSGQFVAAELGPEFHKAGVKQYGFPGLVW